MATVSTNLHRFSTPSGELSTKPCGQRRWRVGGPPIEATCETAAEGGSMARVTTEQIARTVSGQPVATRFRDIVRDRPDQVALRWRHDDGWGEWTWAQYADRVCRVAGALAASGVVR